MPSEPGTHLRFYLCLEHRSIGGRFERHPETAEGSITTTKGSDRRRPRFQAPKRRPSLLSKSLQSLNVQTAGHEDCNIGVCGDIYPKTACKGEIHAGTNLPPPHLLVYRTEASKRRHREEEATLPKQPLDHECFLTVLVHLRHYLRTVLHHAS